MPDLRLIGGGKASVDFEHIFCGHCESGLFNWRYAERQRTHVFGCAVCGSVIALIEDENSHALGED